MAFNRNSVCLNCGKPWSEHVVVSYAGATLMDTPYICPSSVFHPSPDPAPADPPATKGTAHE